MANPQDLPEDYDITKRIGSAPSPSPQLVGGGGEDLPEGYKLPGVEESPYEKDYSNVPWSEVLSSGLQSAPKSFVNAVTAIPSAVINYQDTAEGLKQIAQGISSKVQGELGATQDPSQKAQTEAAVNAVIDPWRWVVGGPTAGVKKALATDPFSVVSALAIPLTGGSSALGAASEAAGAASSVGKALNIASKAAKVGAGVADPLTGTLDVAQLAASKIGAPLVKSAASAASGVSPEAYNQAFQAGKSVDPAIKDAFNTYASGKGNPVDLSQDMAAAVSKLKDQEMTNWAQTKEAALANTQTIPFDKIYDAIADARKIAGPKSTAFGASEDAHNVIDTYERMMQAREASPNTQFQQLPAFDQMKRSLFEAADNTSGMTSQVIKKINSGVTDAAKTQFPEYARIMSTYPAILDSIGTIQKTLGTTPNYNATSEMLKLIRQQNNQTGNAFIQQVAKFDPTIPYKIAGAAVNDAAANPSALSRAISAGGLAHVGYAAMSGNPLYLTGAAAGLAAQTALSSPKWGSRAAYTAGQISGATKPITSSAAATAVPYARQATIGAAMNMQNPDLQESALQPLARKSGGRVSDRLVAAADRAKKNINNNTESLLNVPDTHVAQALELANKYL